MIQPVFDGHNDVLLRLWQHARSGTDPVQEFVSGVPVGHIDGPRAKAGGLVGGLCAIFLPSAHIGPPPERQPPFRLPLPNPLDPAAALQAALAIAAIALRLDRAGAWRLCRSVADIEAACADELFAAVLHMEGCEALDPDLDALTVLHAAGLRSLGPVWSRPNAFGHGVPFAFPSSPDTGPGLTEAGFRLVRQCNRLGIVVDVSHITEAGFWDIAGVTDQPIVASHSNAHALTPASRNLTDRQLDAIAESSGIVGLNYATVFLRADGLDDARTPLADMVRHIDYLVERVGIDGVGLGSDFDGATVPEGIGDAAGTQNLVAALRNAGYGDEELDKICRRNWLRVLAQTWAKPT